MLRTLCSILVSFLLAATASAQDSSPATPAERVARGASLFDEAAALRDSDAGRSDELLLDAIDAWSAAMDLGEFENGLLYYNIATAHLMRDDVGLAILNYRKAEELMPGDRNVVSNLAQARLRVEGGAATPGSGAVGTILFFHSGLSQRARFLATLGGFALTFFLAGLVSLRVLPRGALWFAGAAAAVWLATGTSLAVTASDTTRVGVIAGEAVTGRKGPGSAGYEPSFTRPLSPGVEFTLIEQRGDWALIRLSDGRETWVPRSSARMLDRVGPNRQPRVGSST